METNFVFAPSKFSRNFLRTTRMFIKQRDLSTPIINSLVIKLWTNKHLWNPKEFRTNKVLCSQKQCAAASRFLIKQLQKNNLHKYLFNWRIHWKRRIVQISNNHLRAWRIDNKRKRANKLIHKRNNDDRSQSLWTNKNGFEKCYSKELRE